MITAPGNISKLFFFLFLYADFPIVSADLIGYFKGVAALIHLKYLHACLLVLQFEDLHIITAISSKKSLKMPKG